MIWVCRASSISSIEDREVCKCVLMLDDGEGRCAHDARCRFGGWNDSLTTLLKDREGSHGRFHTHVEVEIVTNI